MKDQHRTHRTADACTKPTVTTSYTYDANGNNTRKETADSITANTYNNFNQLIQVGINGLVATYEYNAQGIRTSKTVGENQTNFLLDGGNVVAEQTGTATTNYLRGINLISKTADTTEYYLFNAYGDVVNLTNSTGTTTKTYDYDAFGNERNRDETDPNPFRYCGEYWDTETGTYYLRARYYDSAIGRFTQADTHWNPSNMIYGDNPQKINEREDKLGLKSYSYAPQISAIMQAGNLYVYCGNNPVLLSDPTGRTAYALQWSSAVWWLMAADGLLPVGDAIYLIGLAATATIDMINMIGVDNIVMFLSEAPRAITDAVQWASDKVQGFVDSMKQQIADAVNCGYQQAIQDGFQNGLYSFFYLGEKITLYFKDGLLQAAYGSHIYSYEELLLLLR